MINHIHIVMWILQSKFENIKVNENLTSFFAAFHLLADWDHGVLLQESIKPNREKSYTYV